MSGLRWAAQEPRVSAPGAAEAAQAPPAPRCRLLDPCGRHPCMDALGELAARTAAPADISLHRSLTPESPVMETLVPANWVPSAVGVCAPQTRRAAHNGARSRGSAGPERSPQRRMGAGGWWCSPGLRDGVSWTSWLRPPENATPSAFQPGTVLTALRDPCTWARLMPHPGSRLDTDLQPQWSSPAVVTVKPGQSEPRGGAGGRQSGGAQAAGGRGGAARGGGRGMRGRVVGSKARARLPAPQAQPHGRTGFSTTDSGAPTPPPGPSALTSPQGTMRFIWSPTPERPVMSLWLRQLKRRPFRSRREPWRWPPGRPGAAAPVQDLRSHPRTPLNRGRRGRDTGVGWMCPCPRQQAGQRGRLCSRYRDTAGGPDTGALRGAATAPERKGPTEAPGVLFPEQRLGQTSKGCP